MNSMSTLTIALESMVQLEWNLWTDPNSLKLEYNFTTIGSKSSFKTAAKSTLEWQFTWDEINIHFQSCSLAKVEVEIHFDLRQRKKSGSNFTNDLESNLSPSSVAGWLQVLDLMHFAVIQGVTKHHSFYSRRCSRLSVAEIAIHVHHSFKCQYFLRF